MRILFGAIAVIADCQCSVWVRGCARRSLITRSINSSQLSAFSPQLSADCRADPRVRAPLRHELWATARTPLDSPVQPIAEVTEAGDDEFVRVELTIDDRRVNCYSRMMLFDERHAFGRGDD